MVGSIWLVVVEIAGRKQLQIGLGGELRAEALAEEDGVAVHEVAEAAVDAVHH